MKQQAKERVQTPSVKPESILVASAFFAVLFFVVARARSSKRMSRRQKCSCVSPQSPPAAFLILSFSPPSASLSDHQHILPISIGQCSIKQPKVNAEQKLQCLKCSLSTRLIKLHLFRGLSTGPFALLIAALAANYDSNVIRRFGGNMADMVDAALKREDVSPQASLHCPPVINLPSRLTICN